MSNGTFYQMLHDGKIFVKTVSPLNVLVTRGKLGVPDK